VLKLRQCNPLAFDTTLLINLLVKYSCLDYLFHLQKFWESNYKAGYDLLVSLSYVIICSKYILIYIEITSLQP
jgi:hypothetical protein